MRMVRSLLSQAPAEAGGWPFAGTSRAISLWPDGSQSLRRRHRGDRRTAHQTRGRVNRSHLSRVRSSFGRLSLGGKSRLRCSPCSNRRHSNPTRICPGRDCMRPVSLRATPGTAACRSRSLRGRPWPSPDSSSSLQIERFPSGPCASTRRASVHAAHPVPHAGMHSQLRRRVAGKTPRDSASSHSTFGQTRWPLCSKLFATQPVRQPLPWMQSAQMPG